MDGTSSGVLGSAGLSELGFDVEPHLPDDRRGHELAAVSPIAPYSTGMTSETVPSPANRRPAGVPLGRPPGMYGRLANRMMGFNGHPVVVVNRPAGPDDAVSGSGRGPRWFDIITSLEQHDGLNAIGHQQARVLRVAKDEKSGHLVAVPQETARVTPCSAPAVPSWELRLTATSKLDTFRGDTRVRAVINEQIITGA
ncbi:hypothetical protein AB0953_05120 [Streptomyces sp. NPDC046866]|uniref:hypothetical protein n=1 Tax=Streptomyces sp. NPDC046866 TaxID=3154921 RepID=UPI0034512B85